jgi:hypothetical protein
VREIFSDWKQTKRRSTSIYNVKWICTKNREWLISSSRTSREAIIQGKQSSTSTWKIAK